MALLLHPTLKALATNCAEWMEHAKSKGEPERSLRELEAYLAVSSVLPPRVGHPLWDIAHYYAMSTCDAWFREDAEAAGQFLNWTMAFRSLRFRLDGTFSAMNPARGNWPTEYRDSLRAAGPSMLSWWEIAKVGAQRYLEMAEKDQKINKPPQSRRIAHNTHDVFLINLFCHGFGLSSSYHSITPVVPAYQSVLDAWRSEDRETFSRAMSTAANFHIARSNDSTGSVFYEFDDYFDRLFPAELLTVQALRKRDGLPAFETSHALIDAPWAGNPPTG
ncbi:hypothetical protein [Xanthomonas phaseoli]|uniref:hypothetical protein n=1 Tax=Xanthomonas phaseoli TaxID=1985254 RepID=UPI001237A35F|nr:hypothetical protein [Xanthomonas phaseoli]MBO9834406.1 hypothetical protein [Xanthomonas phaseoli pv. dieffenbachiae]MBO9838699.1 hypothetical protein [Xanthomonas phaseoli pv. dieffenbachiae]MBO9842636.1 hypothetical protein [Xanthomonas phaseoli pv. dieffenbachiae]MBO9863466.1 hypothetical protein [Xanthomonas phaseoli pv. dieffenbachiae]MBO9864372.1 hypothetical protein [Xanthomonas phaseoli pv. dieffenbachiae]